MADLDADGRNASEVEANSNKAKRGKTKRFPFSDSINQVLVIISLIMGINSIITAIVDIVRRPSYMSEESTKVFVIVFEKFANINNTIIVVNENLIAINDTLALQLQKIIQNMLQNDNN